MAKHNSNASKSDTAERLCLDDAVILNNALSSKGLKAKHVGGENYIRIINLKTGLRNALKTMDEACRDIADEFGMEQVGPGQYVHPSQDKSKQAAFSKKIVEVSRSWKSPGLDLHFVPQGELKEFCKEQDIEVEAILFEFLAERV